MAADLDILPVIRLHEFKCGGDGKYCRWVSRPGPLQEIDKGGLARLGEPGLVAPADDQRLYQVLDLRVGILKTCTFGAEHPFVAVAGIKVSL